MEVQLSDLPADPWDAIVDNTADAQTRQEVLHRAAMELDRALNLRADYTAVVLNTLEEIAGKPLIDDYAWAKIDKALGVALGAEPAHLIAWLVSSEYYDERLAEIAPDLSPTAEAFIRSVLAMYGRPLESAFYLSSTGLADDWREISRNILQDPTSGRYSVRFRIQKYSGEAAVIETSPDGVLSLAHVLLSALNTIGDRRIFYRDSAEFIDEMERFRAMIQSTPFDVDSAMDRSAEGPSPGPASPAS